MTSRKQDSSTKPESSEYEGHRIDIRGHGHQPELLIDNIPVAYGRLPNGKFFLDDYAYDWIDDLHELARRYIAYRGRVEEARRKNSTREEK
jgi:hypothetical protein